jgi:ribosomal protein S18 acetylase RimI-like enzyme
MQSDRDIVQRILSEADVVEANRLCSICNEFEGLDYLTVDPTMVAILCYEGGELVGLLAIQQFASDKAELYLIVHPEKRRRGIGRALFQAEIADCKNRGVKKCLLVCQESSESGKAFVRSTGALYQFSEYRMRLDAEAPRSERSGGSSVELSRAGLEDAGLLAALSAKAFLDSEEGHLERYSRNLPKPTHRFYIISLDTKPIGSIGVVEGKNVYIVAFSIIPEYRGKGYGGEALSQIVEILLGEAHQRILIEVETQNRNALSLYKRCGFVEQAEYAYYAVSL